MRHPKALAILPVLLPALLLACSRKAPSSQAPPHDAQRTDPVSLTSAEGAGQTTKPATLVGPPTWGNPDQPWGARRPVTDADRAKIAGYRSKKNPTMQTEFTKPGDLGSWTLESDDKWNLKSCRLPANIVTSPHGLELQTRDAPTCHSKKWSTGAMASKATYKFGYFEASIKIASVGGLNNAFWLTTDDNYAINIEAHYPSEVHPSVQSWATSVGTAVGFESKFKDDLSADFHDYGFLWTPTEIVFAIDGEPYAAIATKGSFAGNGVVKISTAVIDFAGKVTTDPTGHSMAVRSLKISSL